MYCGGDATTLTVNAYVIRDLDLKFDPPSKKSDLCNQVDRVVFAELLLFFPSFLHRIGTIIRQIITGPQPRRHIIRTTNVRSTQ